MLLRCLGWRKRKREDHTLSYADALVKTDYASIGATARGRRILFAGFVARMGEERLPRRVMFVELVEGKGCTGVRKHDGMRCLEEDLNEFGIKSEGWREAAQKADRWFRWVEDWANTLRRKWHDAERRSAARRHRTVATAARTVDTNGGGGAGASCPMGMAIIVTFP